jgi:hypothetical protein
MSAMAAAFAESGHGILTGMTTRPRSEAGYPMTLGNMRANGVRSVDVACWQCPDRARAGLRAPLRRPARSRAVSGAASGLGGIDPFQCNPDRDRLSSVNFRG